MRNNAGSITRARKLLAYFRESGIEVDYVNSNDFWGEHIPREHIEAMQSEGLIGEHFSLSKKPALRDFLHFLYFAIPRAIYRKLLGAGAASIPNYATNYSRYLFRQILRKKSYDYIIISYAFWADLVRDKRFTGHAKLIIDTHDFLSAQEQSRKGFKLKEAFADEIRRLNLFDEIWVISSDEQYLFSQFCPKKVRLVPISFELPETKGEAAAQPGAAADTGLSAGGTTASEAPSGTVPGTGTTATEKNFDLLYVGSDNPHNIKAADWFFKEVFPRLPGNIRLCIVGKIARQVPDAPNIEKIAFAEQLSDYYKRSRIALCPMLSGTGVKIKVVEALAHGLPVVCSRRGVDGLINKAANGCSVAETAAGFAGQIRYLLENRDAYEEERQRALNFVRNYHSQEALETALNQAFRKKEA